MDRTCNRCGMNNIVKSKYDDEEIACLSCGYTEICQAQAVAAVDCAGHGLSPQRRAQRRSCALVQSHAANGQRHCPYARMAGARQEL